MPRLGKKARREWAVFIGSNGRRQYNGLCRKCQRHCKQSYRAIIVDCRKFLSKRGKREV